MGRHRGARGAIRRRRPVTRREGRRTGTAPEGTPKVRRYVDDEDFRQALQGHETEALTALGIPTATPLRGDDVVRAVMKAWDADAERARIMITGYALHRP